MNNLRLIEIELFSYCNRKCFWCPNKNIDRKNSVYYLDILPHLVTELKQNNYKGFISFSRYNEPFSQINYFKKCLKFIHKNLPDCTLVTNTNGDFLTKENLENLLINELTVMDYDNKGVEKCAQKLLDCGATIDKIIGNYIYAHFNSINILYFCNWSKVAKIGDRGGSLKEFSLEERKYPCFEPHYFVGINYDGTVSPCCNIRNDIEQHKNFILGDLHEKSFLDIINSEKRKNFIKNCANAIFEKDSPCFYCNNKGGRYTREKGKIDYE